MPQADVKRINFIVHSFGIESLRSKDFIFSIIDVGEVGVGWALFHYSLHKKSDFIDNQLLLPILIAPHIWLDIIKELS